MEVERVENLNTSLHLMKAESINFWLGKFVQEVRDQKSLDILERRYIRSLLPLSDIWQRPDILICLASMIPGK